MSKQAKVNKLMRAVGACVYELKRYMELYPENGNKAEKAERKRLHKITEAVCKSVVEVSEIPMDVDKKP